jgi:hypothetical protein
LSRTIKLIINPMTLGNMRANGVWTLAAWCRADHCQF